MAIYNSTSTRKVVPVSVSDDVMTDVAHVARARWTIVHH